MEKPPLYLKLWTWMLIKANFKDDKKLKRGQLFTTIEGMRDAMTYSVGYRKNRPTTKQIRGVYDFLTRGTMTGITKVTGGMVITILNYDKYQNPKNYEGHNEGHDDFQTRGTASSKDKKDKKNDKNRKKDKSFFSKNSHEFRLSKYLFLHMLENNKNSKKPNFQIWARHIDLMLRVDKRNIDDIKTIIKWCQNDPFWKANIWSTERLRDKFDQLLVKMKNPVKESTNKFDLHEHLVQVGKEFIEDETIGQK